MKNVILRDKKRRRLFKKFELRRKVLKAIFYSPELNRKERFYVLSLIKKLPRDSSLVKVRNRCTITGRGRGVLAKYGLSRIMFKKHVNLGHIPGFRKV